ncbi:MAG: phage major capsid protein [Clostridia bacterium]|nr:phage major capsid protein [Clostridia bacterium]
MTMKEKLSKMLTKKKEQRDNLNKALIDCDDKEERAAIGETLSALAQEIADVEAMLAEVDEPAEQQEAAAASDNTENTNERGMNVMATMRNENTDAQKQAEARAQKLFDSGKLSIDNKEARAVLVSSGKLATPTEVAGINDPVGARVSSIVDMVKITDASGMGAYKVAYVDTDATAATQTEGGAYNGSDPTFNFVEIKPQTEAVLSYISKQARKQSPLNYEQKVNESARVALRKRAAEIITEQILASDLVTKLTSVALDEKTLRKIALNYGGDESVVGAAVLLINKADLVTLGDVRGADKKPVYEITPDASNPNTGIIKDGGLAVQYCIDSKLPAGTLVYGQAKCFELALFSNYDILVSEDFAFDKGLLAIRGDVELGGDVTVKGGFVVATTAAE